MCRLKRSLLLDWTFNDNHLSAMHKSSPGSKLHAAGTLMTKPSTQNNKRKAEQFRHTEILPLENGTNTKLPWLIGLDIPLATALKSVISLLQQKNDRRGNIASHQVAEKQMSTYLVQIMPEEVNGYEEHALAIYRSPQPPKHSKPHPLEATTTTDPKITSASPRGMLRNSDEPSRSTNADLQEVLIQLLLLDHKILMKCISHQQQQYQEMPLEE